MKVNANLFWILFVFFVLADVLYVVWNLIDHGGVEWVGAVGIGLSAALAAFLGFYLTVAHRALGGELPEDRLDAAIDDGEAEQGHFAPWSWWPPVLALALALVFLGLAVGVWVSLIGAPLVLIAVVGWHFEFYRGNFAR
jgi:hypothetical protein